MAGNETRINKPVRKGKQALVERANPPGKCLLAASWADERGKDKAHFPDAAAEKPSGNSPRV